MRWFKDGLLALSRPKPMLTVYEDPGGMQAEPELKRLERYASDGAYATVTLYRSQMCFIVEVYGASMTFWDFYRTEEEGRAAFRSYRLLISRAAAAGRVAF